MLGYPCSSSPPTEQIDQMATNLLHLQQHITTTDLPSTSNINQNITKTDRTINDPIQQLRSNYQTYLRNNNMPNNHQDKICFLLEEQINEGNAIAMFEMVYYFRQALSLQLLIEIQTKCLSTLQYSTTTSQQYRCYGELMAWCAIESQQICRWTIQTLIQSKIDIDLCLLILTNQGMTGLVYLYDLGGREIIDISDKILDGLCRSEHIVKNILIPILLQELQGVNVSGKARDIALAILNRLAPLLNDQKILTILVNLIPDPSIDKKLLFATIRGIGLKGQQFLLTLLTSTNLPQNLTPIILSILSIRINDLPILRIKTIEYTLQQCFLPGKLYQYQGSIQPWQYKEQQCTDTLCISSRDFYGYLQMFIRNHKTIQSIGVNNKGLSLLIDVLELNNTNEKMQISGDVINVLVKELKSKVVRIRQTALLELGNIGSPQAQNALESIIRCLYDSDSSIRSAACWTLSRLTLKLCRKVENRLVQLLKDGFWKVRTSACICLGLVITNVGRNTVQKLIKILQDGSVPRSVICQTLIRLNIQQLLLDILRGLSPNDFKMRQSIIGSFEYLNLQSKYLSTIIQELLKYSRDNRIETRELCLITLEKLRKRSQEEKKIINFFNGKNIVPFYYCFLEDTSNKIRHMAVQVLLSFGQRSQLLFIQGLTRGSILTRIQSVRCLGRLGVQNFRAMILGLRDNDQKVRRIAGDTILDNFTIQDIIQQFIGKSTYSLSLVCNLKEVIGGLERQDLKMFLGQILIQLEGSTNKIQNRYTKDQNCQYANRSYY